MAFLVFGEYVFGEYVFGRYVLENTFSKESPNANKSRRSKMSREPEGSAIMALLLFNVGVNVGVEVGQLMIVAAMLVFFGRVSSCEPPTDRFG